VFLNSVSLYLRNGRRYGHMVAIGDIIWKPGTVYRMVTLLLVS